jgi:hypothetical protein
MPDTPTAENRVYLFRELAAAFISAESKFLDANDAKKRSRARGALAELARVASLVSGEDPKVAEELYDRVREDVVGRRKSEAKTARRAARKEKTATKAKPKSTKSKATKSKTPKKPRAKASADSA